MVPLFLASLAQDGWIASPEAGWPQWRGPRRNGVSDERGLLPSWPAGGPRLLWKQGGIGRGWSSPILAAGRIYITGELGEELVLFAFDVEGKLQWRSKNGRAALVTPFAEGFRVVGEFRLTPDRVGDAWAHRSTKLTHLSHEMKWRLLPASSNHVS